MSYDVTVFERDDRTIDFVVHGVTPAFANGIRRAIIADVPTFSIDTVRIIENSSVLFDENIGLRLGLVPLTTPVDEFEPGDTVTLSLDVEGPGTAYSGDLRTSDDLVQPADQNVPIIDLKEHQRIALEADAVLGYGRDHAKHQGGVAVGYRHLQTIEVGDELESYESRTPIIVRGIIEENGNLLRSDEFDNDLTNRYPDREVAAVDVPDAFVFHVESDGSIPVDDLVIAGVRSIRDRAGDLESAVQL